MTIRSGGGHVVKEGVRVREVKGERERKDKRSWSKGRMLPSQGSDPGSSPGGRIFVLEREVCEVMVISIRSESEVMRREKSKKGNRSVC